MAKGKSRKDRKSKRAKEKPEPPPRYTKAWWRAWFSTIVMAVIIFLIIRTFLFATFFITSGSMERTLLVGDFLLVNKMAFGSEVPFVGLRIPGWKDPALNDIVVFRSDHDPGLDIVKRVVGMPGDTLRMEAGILYRNGVQVDEPWAIHERRLRDEYNPEMSWQSEYLVPSTRRENYRPTRDNWGPVIVPDRRYFMLGDNRENSRDSRYWGFAERDKIRGAPIFIYYSYDSEAMKPVRFLSAIRPGRIGPAPD